MILKTCSQLLICNDFENNFENIFIKNLLENDFKNKQIKIFSLKNLGEDVNFSYTYIIPYNFDKIYKDQESEIILIIGLEVLNQISGQPLFEYKLKNGLMKIYDETNIDFTQINNFLYKFNKNKIIIGFLNTSSLLKDKISDSFKENNELDIAFYSNNNEENLTENRLKLSRKILNEMNSFNDALELLEKEKNKFKFEYIYLKTLIYLKWNMPLPSQLKELEYNLENLNCEGKKLLIELLIENNESDKALSLFKDIFPIDELYGATLRLYGNCLEKSTLNPEEKIRILTNLSEKNEEPIILEILANILNENNFYKKSADTRRKLSYILNSQYYELLARVSELKGNPPRKFKGCQEYIEQLIFQNPDLKSEGYYYLGHLAYSIYDSPYLCHNCFKEITIDKLEKEQIKYIFRKKFDIFQCKEKSIKALGKLNLKRKTHQVALAKEKIEILIQGIKGISMDENFYTEYNQYLDSQPIESWIYSLKEYSKNLIKKLENFDPEEFKSASFLYKMDISNKNFDELTFENFVYNLYKKITTETLNLQDIELTLKHLTFHSNYRGLIWGHFFNSILLARTENQKSIENSLTCFFYIKYLDNDFEKKEAQMLGLISWGNIKYRIGNIVEGMACIIAALEIALEIKQIFPFIEIGSLIITKFYTENFNSKEIIEIIKIYNNFYKKLKNTDLKELKALLFSIDDCIKELEKNIKLNSLEKKNSYYENLFKLIGLYAQKQEYDIAGNLIKENNIDDLIYLFKNERKEIGYHALNSLYEIILFTSSNIFDFKNKILLGHKILTEAILLIEEQRNNLKYSEERRYLFDKGTNVYKNYIYNLCILENEKYFTFSLDYEIDKIISVFTLRGIYEERDLSIIQIDRELEILEKKYFTFTREIMTLKDKSSNIYKRKVNTLEKISNILKILHPSFKEIEKFNYMPITDIQSKLKSDQMLFQYVVTKFGIVYLILKKDLKIFNLILIGNDILEINSIIGNFVQNYEMFNSSNFESIENLASTIFTPLMDEIKKDPKIKKLYVIQDLKTNYLSFNFLKYKEKRIIEQLDSIQYLGNFKSFFNNKKIESSKIGIKILGNDVDLYPFKNSLVKYQKKIVDLSNEENFQMLDTLIIVGHGVPEILHNDMGAFRIKNGKKTISVDEIYDLNNVNNLILLSCSSGVSLENQIETNNGVLGKIIKSKIKNALLCRWDVPIKESTKLLELFLEKYDGTQDFHKIINEIKIELSKETKHIGEWGGFESWSF